MRLLCRLAIRNWAARPGRTAVAIGAVALGVALVVAVTSCYESLRVSLDEWVQSWLSRGQVRVQQQVPDDAGIAADLIDRVRAVKGVRIAAPRFRHYIDVADVADTVGTRLGTTCIGIEPAAEYEVRAFRVVAGRLLKATDTDGAMLAEEAAQALRIAPGDSFVALDSRQRPHRLTLVGTIYQPRLGIRRLPHCCVLLDTLRALKPGILASTGRRIHTIDVALEPWASADRARADIEALLPDGAVAVTTPSQVRPIEEGMRLLSVILIWTATGALITAWFMIFATLDLSVVERTRALGTLRCVGAGRGQVAASVFVEAVPLAIVGVGLGLPAGVVVARLASRWFGTVFGRFVVSEPGLWFAAVGGLAATAVAAVVPALNAARVSPIAATRPEARPPRAWLKWPLAAGGALIFAALAAVVLGSTSWAPERLAAVVVIAWPLGLVGMMAILPLVIAAVGWLLRRPAAVLLRLPHRLVSVHVGRTPWRSALVACALAVGVSLVVNLLTNTESIIAGWEVPRQFPDAIMWLPLGVDEADLLQAAALPGVRRLAPVAVTDVTIDLDSQAGRTATVRFLGIDPLLAQRMVQLNFLEGDPREAFAALERGGVVIVPRAFVRSFGLGLGDTVTVRLPRGQSADFRVVGVVESAGLDLAQNYYDAGGFFQAVSTTAMIGSLADARNRLGASRYRLVLFDFDLPEALTDAERMEREQQIILRVRGTIPTLFAKIITMSELKRLIDRDFRRSILWVVFAAGVACLVAGLGVVNLMMSNVAARAKQIAVLRGVGATRGMVCRLIVAEGLILGLIGSGAGLLHGLYMAALSNHLDRVAFAIEPKFTVPWPTVVVGLAVAVVVAVLASILPGIHAGRAAVAEALDSA